jgi:ABC-type branched-subunit amino acid transport system substrate-binding protein
VGEAHYRVGGDDALYQPVVEEVRRLKPDFVFVADYRGDAVAHVARALRQAGLTQAVGAQAVAYDAGLLSLGDTDVEGLILASYFNPRDPAPSVRAFSERCQTRFGVAEPSHLEATTYDSVMLLAEGFKVARTREEMGQFLTDIGAGRPVYQGLTGPFTVAHCLDRRPVHLLTLHQGHYQDLKP